MHNRLLFRYLDLHHFTEEEYNTVFDKIMVAATSSSNDDSIIITRKNSSSSSSSAATSISHDDKFNNNNNNKKDKKLMTSSIKETMGISSGATLSSSASSSSSSSQPYMMINSNDDGNDDEEMMMMNELHLRNFLLQRFEELDQEGYSRGALMDVPPPSSSSSSSLSSSSNAGAANMNKDNDDKYDDDEEEEEDEITKTIASQKLAFATYQALRILQTIKASSTTTTTTTSPIDEETSSLSSNVLQLSRHDFVTYLTTQAAMVEYNRVAPITLSMLLVGSSVGIITPVMPFVVQDLGLSPGQYGMVVSAFALAKMMGNIPSAILVERHGRKPYMTYSLLSIAVGVGGMGMASHSMDLIGCRFITGLGVAALSTAATMTMTDISTPRNRASTMAPMMSAFAAGTALGPAMGGILADQMAYQSLFMVVGSSYIGMTVLNSIVLQETKPQPIVFPWQQLQQQQRLQSATDGGGGGGGTNNTIPRSRQRTTSTNGNNNKDSTTMTEAAQSAMSQWARILGNPVVRNVVWLNGFYWVALAGAQMTLLPLLLTTTSHYDAAEPSSLLPLSATQVGQVYMGMSAVQVLGNPLIAPLVDRMGKGRAMLVGCTLLSTSMGVLPIAVVEYEGGIPALATCLVVWATGSTMLSTAPVAFVSDHTNDVERAQAIALLRTSGDIGFLVGATTAGAMADWTTIPTAIQSSAGILWTATLWFGVVSRRTMRTHQQQQQQAEHSGGARTTTGDSSKE